MKRTLTFYLYFTLSWLLLFNAVYAAELLNLSGRAEGDKSLGENVIVGKNENTGAKYLTGYNDLGRLQFPVNLATDFEVSFKVFADYPSTLQMFLTSEDSFIEADIFSYGNSTNSYLKGTLINSVSLDDTGWLGGGSNVVKLTVKDGTVRLYFNDAFAGKYTLPKANLTYTKLILQGLKADVIKLYEINIGGSAGTVATPTTTPVMKLGGISTRGRVGTDSADYLIAGLLVQGGTKMLIVRAVSVDGIINPRLAIKTYPDGTTIYTNNDWTAGTSAANLQQIKWNPPKTTDAAIIVSLATGLYTLEVSPENVGGVAIVEVYEYPQ